MHVGRLEVLLDWEVLDELVTHLNGEEKDQRRILGDGTGCEGDLGQTAGVVAEKCGLGMR